ncbi:hypothetical protein LOC67_03295 [Stieleria sp. JC731]|uniref:hypothetical protein n=1 Tax=Pirellulaceae TaxID=2691357 RepID=UPI001E392109|nr:hypothetical protein [Stieleria sp. JC731]MCC9599573.1 hypothetical protein [Stieleria sp. JC731]
MTAKSRLRMSLASLSAVSLKAVSLKAVSLKAVIVCASTIIATPAFAIESKLIGQASSITKATESEQPTARKTPKLDPELERNVVEMVENHLPEVKKLLDQLRKKAPKQYETAIRSLARSARRLQTAKKRGEEVFELELQIVQAQSSLNLLIAKLKIRDSKSDRQALAKATEQLAKAELAKLQFELTTLKSRMTRLNQQIADTEAKIDERKTDFASAIEANVEANLRKAGRQTTKP